MDDFTNITTDEEFLEYIKLNLGLPVINIEMVDEQFMVAIADASLEYQKYAGSEGNFQEYCILNLSAGVSYYPISAVNSIIDGGTPVTNVQSISDIQLSTGLDNINALFSPSHILLIENGSLMQNTGNAFGPIINQQGNSAPLSQYTTAIQYLKQVTELFGKSLAIRYIQGRQIIQTIPTPTTGGPCIILVNRGLTTSQLYNYTNFRKLALSRCLKIYSRILRKYQGVLPDGLTINYSDISQDAKELYDEAIVSIKSESAPIDFFVY